MIFVHGHGKPCPYGCGGKIHRRELTVGHTVKRYENESEKLSAFIETILSEAKVEAQSIREESDARLQEQLIEHEAELKKRSEQRRVQQIADEEQRCVRRITSARMDVKRRVLQKREQLADSLFDDVIQRVTAITSEEQGYIEVLQRQLKVAQATLSEGRVILLRAEDMVYAPKLTEGTELHCKAGEVPHGGLILTDIEGRRQVDLSFGTALNELRGKFSELTGFQVKGGALR